MFLMAGSVCVLLWRGRLSHLEDGSFLSMPCWNTDSKLHHFTPLELEHLLPFSGLSQNACHIYTMPVYAFQASTSISSCLCLLPLNSRAGSVF